MIDQSTPEPRERSRESTREQVLRDYRIALESREASLLGRREVLTGKAKFGIFGDGKEVAQLAMAQGLPPGDFRSGYYRDQTLMLALGASRLWSEFFAQLYADADPRARAGLGRTADERPLRDAGSSTAGRLVARSATERYNSSADLSPTGSQMPRLRGTGPRVAALPGASGPARIGPASRDGGNEIAFGHDRQRELRRGAVLGGDQRRRRPRGADAALDLGRRLRHLGAQRATRSTKGDLSCIADADSAARRARVRASTSTRFAAGTTRPCARPTSAPPRRVRREHVPAIVHVIELTQPQGHSTSGSHERYKSAERLAWEERARLPRPDARAGSSSEGLATGAELDAHRGRRARDGVREPSAPPGSAFAAPDRGDRAELQALLGALRRALTGGSARRDELRGRASAGRQTPNAGCAATSCGAAHEALVPTAGETSAARDGAGRLERERAAARSRARYGSDLHSETARARRSEVAPVAPRVRRRRADASTASRSSTPCFDAALARAPELVAFGEDVGQLGDVNQGFAGLQEKYGELRVADTGIREATIIGPGDRAGACAVCGRSPRSSTSTTCSTRCRSSPTTWPTLRYRTDGRPEGAGDRPHARPPARGHLALRLADGGRSSACCAACTSACRAT